MLESGSYKGFMRKRGKNLISAKVGNDEIVIMDIFNCWDISAKLLHRKSGNKDAQRTLKHMQDLLTCELYHCHTGL